METEVEAKSGESFQVVAKAIRILVEEKDRYRDLDSLAARVGLSPFHFQRLFVQLAGVSPKEFAKYLNLEEVKRRLMAGKPTYDAAIESGLSSGSRLHELMISMESLTPGEFKRGGEGTEVKWGLFESMFGMGYLAKTARGIVKVAFVDSEAQAFAELGEYLPNASLVRDQGFLQADIEEIGRRMEGLSPLRTLGLALSGTPFRVHVWRALLAVPRGSLISYQGLAEYAGNAAATRAVASAVALNPIAFVIPCHRVIRSTGETGEYHWGSDRKTMMIVRELAS